MVSPSSDPILVPQHESRLSAEHSRQFKMKCDILRAYGRDGWYMLASEIPVGLRVVQSYMEPPLGAPEEWCHSVAGTNCWTCRFILERVLIRDCKPVSGRSGIV